MILGKGEAESAERRSCAPDSALEKRRNPRPPKTRDADGETRQGLSRGRGLEGWGGAEGPVPGTAHLTPEEPNPPGRGSDLLRRVQATRGRVLTTSLTRRNTRRRGLGWRAAGAKGPEGPGSRRRDRADILAGLGSTKPPNLPILPRSAGTRTGAAKSTGTRARP